MKTYLIDDDTLSVYLTEQLLRAEGFTHTISTFHSVPQALQQLVQERTTAGAQVVFLDLNMPLMNGWQFLDALAPYETELRGHCHIYILTSSLALTDLEKSKAYQLVAGLIHKPIDTDEIRAIHSRLTEPGAPE